MDLEDTEEEELEDADSTENEDDIQFKPQELTNLDALKQAVRQKRLGNLTTDHKEKYEEAGKLPKAQARLPGLRKGTFVKRQRNLFWEGKQERMEEVAAKLAFRQFLKEKGYKRSQKDLELQEIYNRYFFFRREEIVMQNCDEP